MFFLRLSIRASLVRAAAWIPRGPGLLEAQGLWRPGSSGSLLTGTSWQISGTKWEATMRPATNPTRSPRRLRLIMNLCGSCRNPWTSQKCGSPWKWGGRGGWRGDIEIDMPTTNMKITQANPQNHPNQSPNSVLKKIFNELRGPSKPKKFIEFRSRPFRAFHLL